MMSFLSHPKIDRIFQFLEFLLLLFCKTVQVKSTFGAGIIYFARRAYTWPHAHSQRNPCDQIYKNLYIVVSFLFRNSVQYEGLFILFGQTFIINYDDSHQCNTEEHTIKPESESISLDTSCWPLLLKNYDKLMVSLSAKFCIIIIDHL